MSYSHVQENIDYENSCLERLDRLERLVDTCLTMQEENLKRQKDYTTKFESTAIKRIIRTVESNAQRP